MKNRILLIITLLITTLNFAQQGINYKALIKDDLGNTLTNIDVVVLFTIYEGSALTNNVYEEQHAYTTDANGFIILNIGEGNTTNNFNNINWTNGEHFLNVQVNVNGNGLVDLGTTKFMAVPYAKHAETAGNISTKIDDLSDGKSDVNGSSLFIGLDTGLNDDGTSNRNVGLGYRALYLNTNGNDNTANGHQALRNNSTGNFNSANGTSALFFNTIGNYNTASGYRSLYNNTEGVDNTSIGAFSLNENTTGSDNTASGRSALENNITGINNTANGYYAMRFNTTGNNNTSIGRSALALNTVGNNNTATGNDALLLNTVGSNNTATGYNALYNNSNGNNNSVYGHEALYSNTIGHRNVAIGKGAGANNSFGSDNIYIGFEAGSTASLSEDNKLYINNEKSITPLIYGEFDNKIITLNASTTVNGATTIYNSSTGPALSGIKTHTGNSNAAGVHGENTVSDDHGIGVRGIGNKTGVSGTANATGADTYFGLFGSVNGGTGTRVGVRGQALGSSGFRYGVYSVGDLLYTGDLIGLSDRKLKSNIKTLSSCIATIMDLKPSTYNFKEHYQEIMLASDKPQFGFLAQDVQAVLPELVSENKHSGTKKGDPEISFLGVNYIGLIPILTAGIQEQQRHIKNLEHNIDSQSQLIKNLIKRVEALEKR